MQPEFSRIINIDDIIGETKEEKLLATADECSALAKRFNVKAIKDLSATVVISKELSGDVVVKGDFAADLELVSVISLDVFSLPIKDKFKVVFSNAVTDEDVSFDNEEDVEPLTNSRIDIGELVAEYLALAIPSFPKKEGEAFSYKGDNSDEKDANESPFAVLKKLK